MTHATGLGLPTGTVTFLFTDIEGSTAMLAALGERYTHLVDRHASILRDALASHGGVEVNTEGDAFFVAFPSATEAVRAVAVAQRALVAEPWPDDGVVRVRMGLHTGEGRLGGDDYLSLDVNRAARIAAAAHGGQVIISDATRVLSEPGLPTDLALRDLGMHRLKDLPDPQRVWQLDIEGLPSKFPAIRTLDARPTNLPMTLSPLVGRAAELAAVRRLLETRRVVTLTGTGGTGKTRLALAVATSLLDRFSDGVYFVDLQDARDREAVATEIAAVLGVRELVDRGPEQSAVVFLRDRTCLLVLDNFEQVVAAAPIVADLAREAPRLQVIITSREALRIDGEQEYAVPPLQTPTGEASSTPDELAGSESVQLFVQRAREVRPDFRLTESNARHVAGIASRLDGLPLAVELAAARVRILTPQAIESRLESSLSSLGSGGRDRPGRQQTLRGAIDWSYDLLEGEERRLFGRLGVFAGGWTIEAAEAIDATGDEGVSDVLAGIESLVEKSLVRSMPIEVGEPRFDMLQVIRQYARERLETDAEAADVRARQAAWVADLARRAGPELTRSSLREWHARLTAEEENIRTALRWAIDGQDAEVGLAIAGSLWRHWHFRAAAREGCQWLEAVLELPASAGPTSERAMALAGLAGLVYWQGQMERAADLYEEALTIRRALGDAGAIAEVLKDSVWTAFATGRVEQAEARASEAIAIFRSLGDETSAALTEAWLLVLPVFMDRGGDIGESIAVARRAVEAARAGGRPFEEADWLSTVASLQHMRGDIDAALLWGRQALRAFYRLDTVGWFGPGFKIFAAWENARGRYERAATLAAAAARYSEEFGGELPDSMMRIGDPMVESAQRLAPDVHERAVREGAAMSLDAAMAFALEEDVSPH